MKRVTFIITCALMIGAIQVQGADSTFLVSGGGRTDLLNKRYHVKAWVENVSGSGHVLKFTADVSFAKGVIKRWTKNSLGKLVSDDQTTTFNPGTTGYHFMLDSPAYKGGLQYDLLLYVNASDKDYTWRIHLERK